MAAALRWKSVVLWVYDGLSALIVAGVFLAASPAAAYGYIDPSVMTYAIQAVAGVAVALSAVLGVALRRGRRGLMRLLAIDDDAGRIREGRVHRTVPPSGAAAGADTEVQPSEGDGPEPSDAPQAAPGSPEGEGSEAHCDTPDSQEPPAAAPAPRRRFLDRRPYRPSWKVRLAFGAVVAFFFVFTVFFAAPLEIVYGSQSSLLYGVQDVGWLLAVAGLAMTAVLTGVLALLRGRAFNLALIVLCSLGFCAYLQALVLNQGLPAADGATLYWGDYMVQQVLSSVLWAALVAIAVAYSLHNRRRAQGIAALMAGALVAVQGLGLAALLWFPGAGQQEEAAFGERAVMTEEGLYSVSPKDNVIVFVLDTFDDAYLKRILKQDPALLDEFTGFTSYENCTGAMIPTRFAVPQMLTGQMPGFDEPFSEYKRERYARGDFLDTMAQAGYSVGLYTDSLTISDLPADEQAAVNGTTVNIHSLPDSTMEVAKALGALYQMALYRDVPWSLKWAFWYYTDQINGAMAAYDPQAPADETIYVMDDVRYYQRLQSLGLFVDDGGEAGAFRFIHLLGSHYPFSYDENGQDIGEDSSDVFRQSRGALHIVSEYLRQMKELGVYDQATIIVTADHGYWTITEEPLEETSNPIMFVKPAETPEEAARPLVVDEKPVSQLDLQPTILDAMGLDYSAYGEREDYPGYSIFDPIDPDRRRLYLTTDSEPDLTETQFREYAIEGNALDFGNWHETGRTLDAQK